MADINQFIKETNAEIEKLQAKQVKEAKGIVLGAYTEILERSPVDTSLFKHNHLITVNTKSNKTKDEKRNIQDNQNEVNKAKFKANDTITIQNNLAYAEALEAGRSKQAPAGVYGIAEEKVRKKIGKRIVVK